MENPFIHLLRVRYSEVDAQKVVFNGKYAEYVDIAGTEFMRTVWGDYQDVVAEGYDYQVVHLSISWTAPAHFDEVIAVAVETAHIGNSSFRLKCEFHNHHTGQALATAEIVYVMISTEDHSKQIIPDGLKTKLVAGAPGVVVNHAGV